MLFQKYDPLHDYIVSGQHWGVISTLTAVPVSRLCRPGVKANLGFKAIVKRGCFKFITVIKLHLKTVAHCNFFLGGSGSYLYAP